MNKRYDDKLIYKIIRLWPIIISVVLVLVTFGMIKKELAYTAEELDSNRLWHEEIDERIARLEEAMNQLPEIRADIKCILKEMRN